ncbi:MAG: radical SAM protein [Erysipelotrichaceae bacterium]|nr:radical SAM protein [Erysipelotrichaceae bacterium]
MRFKKVYVEINNTCNFNCSFCIHTERKKELMSIEKFSHIINEIKDYTEYIYLHIMGEPLLHPNLNDFVNICKNNNLKVNITTNGSLLKKKKDILVNNPIRQINISLHSIEKEDETFYEYIKDVLDVVDEILEKTDTYISLRLWNVEDENNSRQDYILKTLSDIYNVSLDSIELKNYRSITIRKNLFLSMDRRFIWPSLKNEVFSLTGRCKGLKEMCGILVDGTVVPCCLDAQGDINLGNIFKDSFKTILDNKRTKNILEGWNKNTCSELLCKKCSYRGRFGL